MVQLKLIEKVNPSHPDKDFNSIMVQLKPRHGKKIINLFTISIP